MPYLRELERTLTHVIDVSRTQTSDPSQARRNLCRGQQATGVPAYCMADQDCWGWNSRRPFCNGNLAKRLPRTKPVLARQSQQG